MSDDLPTDAAIAAVPIRELAHRRPRSPDRDVESRTLRRMARALGEGAGAALERLPAEIAGCCGADAAGVDLLAAADAGDEQAFEWHAMAAADPREKKVVTACGRSLGSVAAEHEEALLFPGHALAESPDVDPPIVEALVAPFYVAGEPGGTLWAISRTRGRHFDAEDARVLEGLSHFAAASVRTCERPQSYPVRNNPDAGAPECSEHGLRQVLEALPAAVYMTDAEGRLTNFNAAAVAFSGRVPELQTDRWCVSWKLYYADGRRMPHDQCPMAEALRTGESRQGVEAIAERPDGSRVRFEANPVPLYDAEGNISGAINMLVDLGARESAEARNCQADADRKTDGGPRLRTRRFVPDVTQRAAIDEAQARLAAIVESSDDAIVSKDLEGRVLTWNRGAERLTGYSAEEAIGQPIGLVVPPDRREEVANILRRTCAGQRVEPFETVRQRKDGSPAHVSLAIFPLFDARGNVIGASSIARDITARKRAEAALVESEARMRDLNQALEERVSERTAALEQQAEKLQELAIQLTAAEQRERKRLAALLHDDLQQIVVAAQLQLRQCTGRVNDPLAANAIAKVGLFLTETLSVSRDLTRELRPPVLYERGLGAALRQLATDMQDRYGLHVKVQCGTQMPPLSDDLKALLFVCSRELLINSAKHAEADSAAVEIGHERGQVRVTVEDAGRGFGSEAIERAQADAGGFGLFSIQERLAALGGKAEIESAPGEGARITLRVPAESSTRFTERL